MPELEIPKSFKNRVDKKGKKKPQLVSRIIECIHKLGEDPHHPGLHSSGVKGSKGVFESYVDAANRITWHWDSGVIVLRNHCNHDIVGRSP